MEALFLLFALVIGGAALFMHHQRQQRLIAVWGALASREGLHFEDGGFLGKPSLSGDIGGVGVGASLVARKHGKSSVMYVRVATRPTLPMPDGLAMTPENLGAAILKMAGGQDIQIGDAYLDGKARICAQNEGDVQALFEHAPLRQACLSMFSGGRYNRVSSSQIIVERRSRDGDEIHALLSQALKIARAFDAARLAPWQHLARTHGLQLEVGRHNIIASGTIDGLEVRARGVPQPGRTEISVRIPAPMPTKMRVVSGEQPGAVPLGDPILDGMISASGAPAEALRALLCGDGMRGELLSVLHAFPASRVADNTVELVMPVGSVGDLGERVRDACRLATALAAQAQQQPQPQGSAVAQQAHKART